MTPSQYDNYSATTGNLFVPSASGIIPPGIIPQSCIPKSLVFASSGTSSIPDEMVPFLMPSMGLPPVVPRLLQADPDRPYGINGYLSIQGQDVRVYPSQGMSNNVGRVSREYRQQVEADRKLEAKRLGKKVDRKDRTDTIQLTDKVHASYMRYMRRVDTSTLNFNGGLLAVTINYPFGAKGPDVANIWKGVSDAIKRHPVYGTVRGMVYREMSRYKVIHEHLTLNFSDGVDVVAFLQFLWERYTFHVKKQSKRRKLLEQCEFEIDEKAIDVEVLQTHDDWDSWVGYAARRGKEIQRRDAYLPGGGAWTHKFGGGPMLKKKGNNELVSAPEETRSNDMSHGPFPVCEKQKTKLSSGAQVYGAYALVATEVKKAPADFRPWFVHLERSKTQDMPEIIKSLGDEDVPWNLPGGVAREEFEACVRSDGKGLPSIMEMHYGDIYRTERVAVTTEGLKVWGDLLRELWAERKAAGLPAPSPGWVREAMMQKGIFIGTDHLGNPSIMRRPTGSRVYQKPSFCPSAVVAAQPDIAAA